MIEWTDCSRSPESADVTTGIEVRCQVQHETTRLFGYWPAFNRAPSRWRIQLAPSEFGGNSQIPGESESRVPKIPVMP